VEDDPEEEAERVLQKMGRGSGDEGRRLCEEGWEAERELLFRSAMCEGCCHCLSA
jgi:hypothetical protein